MESKKRGRGGVRASWLLIGWCLSLLVLGLSAAMAQEATPKKYDKAEAKQLIVQAEAVAAKITESALKIDAQEDVALAKAMAGDYEGARVIARTLGTDASKAKILQQIAVSQALTGEIDTAVKTLGGIKAADKKIEAAYQMAKDLVKLGRKDEALFVLEEMMERVLSKVQGDFVIGHCAFILGDGIARAGRPALTSKFAAVFKGDPVAEEINAALLTSAKAYNNDLAGAKAKYAQIHSNGFKITALVAIAELQLKTGDKAGAAESCQQMTLLAQEMPGKTLAVLTAAGLQQELGDLQSAQATIASALTTALKEEDQPALMVAVMMQTRIGDVEGALKTLAQIKDGGMQAMARREIALAKAQMGDVPGALALAAPDADTYAQAKVLSGAAQGILKSLKPVEKH